MEQCCKRQQVRTGTFKTSITVLYSVFFLRVREKNTLQCFVFLLRERGRPGYEAITSSEMGLVYDSAVTAWHTNIYSYKCD